VSIKVSVCYNRRDGSEFASASIADVELDASLLDQPTIFALAVKTAYQRCREAVDTQLIGHQAAAETPAVQAPGPPRPAAVPTPPAAVATPPPPTAPTQPPAVAPAPNGASTYYANRKQRNQDGPPTTGPQLGGVAKRLGALGFFQALGAAQTPPLPKYIGDWEDNVACWAWTVYQAAQIPPQGVANGVAAPH
jgi:hypothetical protein